ncbi:hypothetical protein V1525DRAFT_407036 [Lipomyces kononenkoae]|uniref:Uncharacterized protein n=1 Tax=Lipomyces kononenkoae TaxID=34357 RepID=A0ACC3SXW9_LIPKO
MSSSSAPTSSSSDGRPSDDSFRDVSPPPSPTPSMTSSVAVPLLAAWKNPLPEWKTQLQLPSWWSRLTSVGSKNHRLLIGIQAVAAVYLICLFARFQYYGPMTHNSSSSSVGTILSGQNSGLLAEDMATPITGHSEFPLNVFLVNTPKYHFEVFVPMIETFKRIDNLNITLFSTEDGMSKWGLRNAVEVERGGLTLLDAQVTPVDKAGVNPEFIFLTTCPEDIRVLGRSLEVALNRGAHVMCIVHQAHLWDYRNVEQYANEISFMRPWVERGQWHFAALSHHVHTYIVSNFEQYLDTPGLEYHPFLFHPVFNLTAPLNLDFNSTEPFAIIPGKFESERRNYDAIFTEYGQLNCDINLRLVGSGVIPRIADVMNPKIGFITNLNFFEYFHEMSKAVAIIPTLGNDHYLKSQASSTVATSIIAGTPLIASQQFIFAHSQIPVEAVWLQGEQETELQVLQRVGHLNSTEWQHKKTVVERLRWSLIRENVARAERMLNVIGGNKYGSTTETNSGTFIF